MVASLKRSTVKVLVALIDKWRMEGECWTGTPEDARSQHCADDLEKVLGELGESVRENLSHDTIEALLKENGVSEGPIDTKIKFGFMGPFMRVKRKKFISDAIKELKSGKRPADIVIGEKMLWGYEYGYEDGVRGRSNLVHGEKNHGNKRSRSGGKAGKRRA